MSKAPKKPAFRSLYVLMVVAGMTLLFVGYKWVGLAVFMGGNLMLEHCWRQRRPNFKGGFQARWKAAIDFYEATHSNKTNRLLHIWGIPLIAGSAIGLFILPVHQAPWIWSAGIFAFGWVLNIWGHAFHEKNAPAFADDPLSFVAGPVWDLKQVVVGSAEPNA